MDWLDELVIDADDNTWFRWMFQRQTKGQTGGQMNQMSGDGDVMYIGTNQSKTRQKRRFEVQSRTKTVAQNVLKAVRRRRGSAAVQGALPQQRVQSQTMTTVGQQPIGLLPAQQRMTPNRGGRGRGRGLPPQHVSPAMNIPPMNMGNQSGIRQISRANSVRNLNMQFQQQRTSQRPITQTTPVKPAPPGGESPIISLQSGIGLKPLVTNVALQQQLNSCNIKLEQLEPIVGSSLSFEQLELFSGATSYEKIELKYSEQLNVDATSTNKNETCVEQLSESGLSTAPPPAVSSCDNALEQLESIVNSAPSEQLQMSSSATGGENIELKYSEQLNVDATSTNKNETYVEQSSESGLSTPLPPAVSSCDKLEQLEPIVGSSPSFEQLELFNGAISYEKMELKCSEQLNVDATSTNKNETYVEQPSESGLSTAPPPAVSSCDNALEQLELIVSSSPLFEQFELFSGAANPEKVELEYREQLIDSITADINTLPFKQSHHHQGCREGVRNKLTKIELVEISSGSDDDEDYSTQPIVQQQQQQQQQHDRQPGTSGDFDQSGQTGGQMNQMSGDGDVMYIGTNQSKTGQKRRFEVQRTRTVPQNVLKAVQSSRTGAAVQGTLPQQRVQSQTMTAVGQQPIGLLPTQQRMTLNRGGRGRGRGRGLPPRHVLMAIDIPPMNMGNQSGVRHISPAGSDRNLNQFQQQKTPTQPIKQITPVKPAPPGGESTIISLQSGIGLKPLVTNVASQQQLNESENVVSSIATAPVSSASVETVNFTVLDSNGCEILSSAEIESTLESIKNAAEESDDSTIPDNSKDNVSSANENEIYVELPSESGLRTPLPLAVSSCDNTLERLESIVNSAPTSEQLEISSSATVGENIELKYNEQLNVDATSTNETYVEQPSESGLSTPPPPAVSSCNNGLEQLESIVNSAPSFEQFELLSGVVNPEKVELKYSEQLTDTNTADINTLPFQQSHHHQGYGEGVKNKLTKIEPVEISSGSDDDEDYSTQPIVQQQQQHDRQPGTSGDFDQSGVGYVVPNELLPSVELSRLPAGTVDAQGRLKIATGCKGGNIDPGSTSQKPFKCPTCEKRFTVKSSCDWHLKLVHNVCLNSHVSSEKFKAGDSKKYKCQFCDKWFRFPASRKTHERIHTGEKPFKCSICEKHFSQSSNRNIHMKQVHTVKRPFKRPFKCHFCDKWFRFPTSRKTHERIHTGKKPFKCSICEKHFSQSSSCNLHMKLVHTDERPFKCQFCDKRMKTRLDLKRHERIHTGEKPFKCSICEKHFSQASHCNLHMKLVHTNERPFKCPTCEKCFAVQSECKRHMKLVHSDERPFKCQFCDKRMKTLFTLQQHERIHTGEKPFKCPTCEKCFAVQSQCNLHMKRVHTGERPFKCQFCDKRMKTSSYLKQHERIHTGEKPFKCPICEKHFSQATNCKKHMKYVHHQ
ncbi:uncharacterized protein LOC141909516 isoform X1 [Tubulanus polymorphus]|uniref:uncharacterized protein LOC141909516 isoform X1 n=1 Tax=Tubulanus polymorphus TaxID=672921 RepID=UPI003DA2F3E5